MCGVTSYPSSLLKSAGGLSPRVRGHPCTSPRWARCTRSIPACAGSPRAARSHFGPGRVYPRVCGVTWIFFACWTGQEGLSPRVRGHPFTGELMDEKTGSIPACAGSPVHALCWEPCVRVYPRVCGVTLHPRCALRAASGLSPRVRGHRGFNPFAVDHYGSIPACAGSPVLRQLPRTI